MKNRRLLPYFFLPAIPLFLPLIAMQFTAEVQWNAFDFIVAYVLLAGAGFAYRFATTKADTAAYRWAAALAVGTALLLIWINLAVGFIGSENNPANLIFGGVIIVGVIGVVLARLEPLGMSRALFATAVAQFLAPVLAWVIWQPGFDAGVIKIFILNGFFVFLFAMAALMFRNAGHQRMIED